VDSIIKLQGFARIIISKRKALDLKIIKNISKYQLYRTKVVEEILSTEESYVKDLEMLNKVCIFSMNFVQNIEYK